MIRILIVLLIALNLGARWQTASGQTADTLSLADKVVRTTSFVTEFRGEVWDNPALYYYYTPYTWTNLEANGIYHDKEEASLRQEGDKETRIGIDVRSFVKLSERSRVFGTAGYKNEKQENVIWNENIDWQLVAPYVTGDSIGGFLKGETYYFNGGYANESGLWTWGITGGYRASHNYRDKDPRPRNTASDLSFATGMAYHWNGYRLGIAADFRLYQQNCEISFLADKGSTSVYHMLGLGMDYVRFAGTQTGVKYQGTQWGGSIGLLPIETDKGLSAVISANHMSMDKKLSGANNLTLLNLGTTSVQGNVAWMRKIKPTEYIAIKMNAYYTIRKGTEYLYGEAGGSSYGTLISTSPGIKIRNSQMSVEGLWEKLPTEQCRWGGAIVPSVAFRRLETDYNTVSRFVHVSVLESSLRARLQYRKRKLHLTAEANGGYSANLSATYSLPGLDAAKSSAQTLLANITYLSSDYGTIGARFQGDYLITKQYNLFLAIQWQMVYYKECGTPWHTVCSLGVFF